MMSMFSDLVEEAMEIFMDDFSVYGSSFEKFLENLEIILQRCQDKNLALNWEKCHFMVDSCHSRGVGINNISILNSFYCRSKATAV